MGAENAYAHAQCMITTQGEMVCTPTQRSAEPTQRAQPAQPAPKTTTGVKETYKNGLCCDFFHAGVNKKPCKDHPKDWTPPLGQSCPAGCLMCSW